MIPDYRTVVSDLAAQYPAEWAQAHTGSAQTEAFIRRLAARLYALDPRFGLNGKRGNPDDISDDAICFDGYAAGQDYDPTRNNAPVTVIDVIGGAGGPNPVPAWAYPLTPAAAAWVRPVAGTEPPVAPPRCQFQPATGLHTQVTVLQAAVDATHDDVLALQEALAVALDETRQVKALLANVSARLEQGGVLDASVKYLGAVRGKVTF